MSLGSLRSKAASALSGLVGLWRSKSTEWRAARIGLAMFSLLGLWGLIEAVNVWVGLAAAAFVLLAAFPALLPKVAIVLLRLTGALLVAGLVLLGVNRPLDRLPDPPIVCGLVLAMIVFAPVAYWYLRGAGWNKGPTALVAVLLACSAILGAPYLVSQLKDESMEVEPARDVRSKIDVLIVTDGRPHPAPLEVPPDPTLKRFNVQFSVGYAVDGRTRWTLTDTTSASEALRVAAQGTQITVPAAKPRLRGEADSVLVLLVDGTEPVMEAPQRLTSPKDPADDIPRWRQIALSAASPSTPTFALLASRDENRIAAWKRFTPHGRAVSLQSLASRTVTDAALRVSTSAPTSSSDFGLALAYMPVLLFHETEPVPRPLSIEAMFDNGLVRLCQDDGETVTDCGDTPIFDPSSLRNGGTHLRIDLPKSEHLIGQAATERKAALEAAREASRRSRPPLPAGTPSPGAPILSTSGEPLGRDTAVYVHPVSRERKGVRLLYLDYWWYLPDNPAGVAGGGLCGAGLVIPGVTCHDHESDWEGVTVVVNRTTDKPEVVAVHYAQHSDVVRYRWTTLTTRWRKDKLLAPLANYGPDVSGRPLAFVARGTHATYPTPCPPDCRQVANNTLGETPHRGQLPWIGNFTATCGTSSCLAPLPTRRGGTEPALWNDFAGLWGERHCALTYYCDSGDPPAAPGRQGRYRNPIAYDGIVNDRWKFQAQPFDGRR